MAVATRVVPEASIDDVDSRKWRMGATNPVKAAMSVAEYARIHASRLREEDDGYLASGVFFDDVPRPPRALRAPQSSEYALGAALLHGSRDVCGGGAARTPLSILHGLDPAVYAFDESEEVFLRLANATHGRVVGGRLLAYTLRSKTITRRHAVRRWRYDTSTDEFILELTLLPARSAGGTPPPDAPSSDALLATRRRLTPTCTTRVPCIAIFPTQTHAPDRWHFAEGPLIDASLPSAAEQALQRSVAAAVGGQTRVDRAGDDDAAPPSPLLRIVAVAHGTVSLRASDGGEVTRVTIAAESRRKKLASATYLTALVRHMGAPDKTPPSPLVAVYNPAVRDDGEGGAPDVVVSVTVHATRTERQRGRATLVPEPPLEQSAEAAFVYTTDAGLRVGVPHLARPLSDARDPQTRQGAEPSSLLTAQIGSASRSSTTNLLRPPHALCVEVDDGSSNLRETSAAVLHLCRRHAQSYRPSLLVMSSTDVVARRVFMSSLKVMPVFNKNDDALEFLPARPPTTSLISLSPDGASVVLRGSKEEVRVEEDTILPLRPWEQIVRAVRSVHECNALSLTHESLRYLQPCDPSLTDGARRDRDTIRLTPTEQGTLRASAPTRSGAGSTLSAEAVFKCGRLRVRNALRPLALYVGEYVPFPPFNVPYVPVRGVSGGTMAFSNRLFQTRDILFSSPQPVYKSTGSDLCALLIRPFPTDTDIVSLLDALSVRSYGAHGAEGADADTDT